jgi:hypothetical protein
MYSDLPHMCVLLCSFMFVKQLMIWVQLFLHNCLLGQCDMLSGEWGMISGQWVDLAFLACFSLLNLILYLI